MFQGQEQGKFSLVESEVLEYMKRLQNEACAVSHKLTQNHVLVTVTASLLVILKPAAVG